MNHRRFKRVISYVQVLGANYDSDNSFLQMSFLSQQLRNYLQSDHWRFEYGYSEIYCQQQVSYPDAIDPFTINEGTLSKIVTHVVAKALEVALLPPFYDIQQIDFKEICPDQTLSSLGRMSLILPSFLSETHNSKAQILREMLSR